MSTRPNFARATLTVAAAVLALGAVWTMLERATVPVSLDATVTAVAVRNRNSGGADVYLVELDDGRTLIVDRHVARWLTPGVHVTKSAWSMELTSDRRGSTSLWRARELLRMVVVMAVLLGMIVILQVNRPRLLEEAQRLCRREPHPSAP